MDQRSMIGLVGLAVMGQNLALNIADHGFSISVYNRTTEKTHAFLAAHPQTLGPLTAADTIERFVASLQRPRKIILLVKAGAATDAVIDELAALLDRGDIIIDGGNARWTDTIRRERQLSARGLRFIGSGVSGGEEGARFGPSLMPGGDASAYAEIEEIWTAIAAKVDGTSGKPLLGGRPGHPVIGGLPCTAYIGPNGAGHYVKMVHNGIEYGDMQMICEAYSILAQVGGMTAAAIADVFKSWNQGPLDSFLIEITADILAQRDPDGDGPLVEKILDTAEQKGTGRWTSISALDTGVPAPTIAEAVFARCLSAIKDERVRAQALLPGPAAARPSDRNELIAAVHDALYCAKICSYAQGFQLLRAAQSEYDWQLNFGQIASIWRGGCIIRARFLQRITEAYERDSNLPNLLLDEFFRAEIARCGPRWRQVVGLCATYGQPIPTFASALSYYDGYRTATLPANLLQAQRDYFGAHSYERIDRPRGQYFHLDWPDPQRPQIEL